MATETKQGTQQAVRQQTAAQQIAEYEAEIYKQKRDARAARKMFKTTLGRGQLR